MFVPDFSTTVNHEAAPINHEPVPIVRLPNEDLRRPVKSNRLILMLSLLADFTPTPVTLNPYIHVRVRLPSKPAVPKLPLTCQTTQSNLHQIVDKEPLQPKTIRKSIRKNLTDLLMALRTARAEKRSQTNLPAPPLKEVSHGGFVAPKNPATSKKQAMPLNIKKKPAASKPIARFSSVNQSNSTAAKPANGVVRRSSPVGRAVNPGNATVARSNDWTHWLELSILFSGFPSDITTRDLWTVFSKEGDITLIELFEDTKIDGRGRIRFSPPPSKAFWYPGPYMVTAKPGTQPIPIRLTLQYPQRSYMVRSIADPKIVYPEVMTMIAEYLDFGFMYEPSTMMGMYRVHPTSSTAVTFRQNMVRREIEVTFQLILSPSSNVFRQEISAPLEASKKSARIHDYSFVIPLAQPLIFHQLESGPKSVILISMETPPNFYRKFDPADTHQPGATFWTSREALFRQTDIVYDPRKLRAAPLTLKKTKPIVDIGRWTTYRFSFDMAHNSQKVYEMLYKALRDYNIDIQPFPDFKFITNREPAVWDYIDKPLHQHTRLTALDDLMAADVSPLPFPVRYQLEVCISEGCLNEYNLTREFVDKLMTMEMAKAQELLEYVAGQKRRVYNPLDIFNIRILKGSASRPKIPHYCTHVRSVIVTPSTLYFSTPTVETSNRIVRRYAEYSDRFLRVRFTDEKFQGRIHATDGEDFNEIFTRIKRALMNGITIGDRHFEFLASGNSQFRENGAYFFAPLDHLQIFNIRQWMGDFREIKVVARHVARLGQCFSTTRAINGTKVTIVEIQDHYAGKFCFTDGVGKISKFLAQMTASEMGISMPGGEPPSVFQFRLGGCKGVLTLSPDPQMREIHIRKSQYKFPACHEGLEIIRWSQFSAAHLNRQLIMVLSALGVPDQVFNQKLKQQLSNLAQAMVDETMALKLLQKEIDPNQMTLALAGLVLDGFQRVREPFVMSLLKLWRAWSIKYLKEKAKIVIHEGASLLGCVDETKTLRGHWDGARPDTNVRLGLDANEVRINSLPEVFVQLSNGLNDKPQVILGPIVLARNPSLHPGDIRIVRGVDVPALHSLKDAVVLPQTGDKDIAGMCSGGDLDGDDYVVIWDKQLLPSEWNHEPMDYTPPIPVEVEGDVTNDDITSFFVTYMKNDSLRRIALAHIANADQLPDGVKDEKCLRLAALHSKAVDYPKTGEPARMTPDLRPKKWPHYMDSKYRRKDQMYISKKILGQLYDQVERVDFVPEYEVPFDQRILHAFPMNEQILADAAELKTQYDTAMNRIMTQHDIGTEHEVWSTFVLHHANLSKDFKFHEEMGSMSYALKDRFRNACWEKAGGNDFDTIGPFVVAMYKVTSDEMGKALEERRRTRDSGAKEDGTRRAGALSWPLMSFPWIFQDVLGKIANGKPPVATAEDTHQLSQLHGGVRKVSGKKSRSEAGLEKDDLETAGGITQRGQILELFHHDVKSDALPYLDLLGHDDALGSMDHNLDPVTSAKVDLLSSGEEALADPGLTAKLCTETSSSRNEDDTGGKLPSFTEEALINLEFEVKKKNGDSGDVPSNDIPNLKVIVDTASAEPVVDFTDMMGPLRQTGKVPTGKSSWLPDLSGIDNTALASSSPSSSPVSASHDAALAEAPGAIDEEESSDVGGSASSACSWQDPISFHVFGEESDGDDELMTFS